jgi:hypothetical protein
MTYCFSIKKELASVSFIARNEAISFLVSDNKRLLQSFLFRNDLSFYYQEINKLVYRHCEVRSNLIFGYPITKDCFNRFSFAMTYRFSIKKELASVSVITSYEAISFFAFDNKRLLQSFFFSNDVSFFY